MSLEFIEEENLPWLKDLPVGILEGIQKDLYPAERIFTSKKGYLIETLQFKCFVFLGSKMADALYKWEHLVSIQSRVPTPTIQPNKAAKNGFLLGLDSDNPSEVEIVGSAYYLTPHAPTPGESRMYAPLGDTPPPKSKRRRGEGGVPEASE